MESFPFQLYSKYDNNEKYETRQNNSNTMSNSLDSCVNRIAKSIANTVIRSNIEENQGLNQVNFRIPKIPQEVFLFGAVITSKILLFWAYKKAKDSGLEILNL